MLISQLNADKLTDEIITSLLFQGLEDDDKEGDCIFVFGSSKAVAYRLPKAVELYNSRRAGKILVSGGVCWDESQLTEAEQLKNKAIQLGVPEDDILVEKVSQHTKENVLASLLLLDRAFYLHNINRLLIVTATYHMRRTFLTLKTYMPQWIQYSLCPVNDHSTTTQNWNLTEIGRKRAYTEAQKLIKYVQQGVIIDCEIAI